MRHDYSTDKFQAFSAGGARKFLGPGSLAHPTRSSTVFRGVAHFCAFRKSGAFSERCNCKPAQIVTRGQRQLLAFFRAGCGLYLEPAQ